MPILRPMSAQIARVWRGVVRTADADEYADYDDIDVAVYYPKDDEFLLERDERVAHFEVIDRK